MAEALFESWKLHLKAKLAFGTCETLVLKTRKTLFRSYTAALFKQKLLSSCLC